MHYMLKKAPRLYLLIFLLTSPTPKPSKPPELCAFLVVPPERGWCKSQ